MWKNGYCTMWKINIKKWIKWPIGDVFSCYFMIFPATLFSFCQSGSHMVHFPHRCLSLLQVSVRSTQMDAILIINDIKIPPPSPSLSDYFSDIWSVTMQSKQYFNSFTLMRWPRLLIINIHIIYDLNSTTTKLMRKIITFHLILQMLPEPRHFDQVGVCEDLLVHAE